MISLVIVSFPFVNGDSHSGYTNWMGSLWYVIMIIFVLPLLLNCLIVFFTFNLIWLHIKLTRSDLTAYEYLAYKQHKQEWKEDLKDNFITEEEYKTKVYEAKNKEGRKTWSWIVKEVKAEERKRRWEEKIEVSQMKLENERARNRHRCLCSWEWKTRRWVL